MKFINEKGKKINLDDFKFLNHINDDNIDVYKEILKGLNLEIKNGERFHILHHPKGWKHLGGSLAYKPSSVLNGHLSSLHIAT